MRILVLALVLGIGIVLVAEAPSATACGDRVDVYDDTTGVPVYAGAGCGGPGLCVGSLVRVGGWCWW